MEERVLQRSATEAPFPLLSITSLKSRHFCEQFQDPVLPTLFIASYPKSGTTWMQCIIYHLLTRGKRPDIDHISNFTPFFDASGTFDLSHEDPAHWKLKDIYDTNHRQQLGYHVFNTHFSWEMLPHSKNMKYIYVIRDGRDAQVSFYHHLRNQDDADAFTGTFTEFLQLSLAGNIPYGSRMQHVVQWWKMLRAPKNLQPDNYPILFVRYEALIHNLKEELRKIIEFLALTYSDAEIEFVSQFMSFPYMKTHKQRFAPISVPWKPGYDFIRKGEIGDHKTLFSEDDERLYAKAMEEVMLSLREEESAGYTEDELREVEQLLL